MPTTALRPLTPSEVEARLPLLNRIARDLVETWRARSSASASGAPDREEGGEPAAEGTERSRESRGSADLRRREAERQHFETFKALSREIEELGGVVSEARVGLIEFPGQVDGKPAWLSWKLGESRVENYRPTDAPRGTRMALPEGPPPPGAPEGA